MADASGENPSADTTHRLYIEYTITWQSPWHVGSGFGSATVDRLVRRRAGATGRPFVPGSQIRGVLRHVCEQLAAALGVPTVPPHALDADSTAQLVRHFGPLARSELAIDRLFGSRYEGGYLFVSDATPHEHSTSGAPSALRGPADTEVRMQTAIDRATGTVLEQRLFSLELAQPHVNLAGRIRGRHPWALLTVSDGFPLEYALLVAALPLIPALGGNKSAGLGRCQIAIERIEYNGQRREVKSCLQSFEEYAQDEDWALWLTMLREQQR